MAGTVLDVEPQDFITSSSSAATSSRALASAGSTLRSGLSGASHMAGSDQTGLKWAAQYDRVAADAVAGLDSLEYAFGQIAAGLSITGLNYATADWLSAGKAGHAPGYTVPSLPALACSAAPPSAAGGSRTSDIPGWEYVANFIGDMWPDGDTGKLRHAQSVWSAFADHLDTIHGSDVPRILSALDDMTTPELPTIHSTVATVTTGVANLATESRNLAKAAGDLADQIDEVHQQTEQALQELLEQIAATAAVGIGLTIFTAGLSDAAAGLAAGGEIAATVARILSWIAELGTNVARIVDSVATSAGAIAKSVGIADQITIRIVTIAGNSVVTGIGGGVTNVGVQEIVDSGSDIEDAFVNGFVGGAAFGAIGEAGSMARVYAVKLRNLKSDFVTWSANGPAGYSLYGKLSESDWFKTYFKGLSHKTYYPDWKWPGAKGFEPGTAVPNTLSVGQKLSRISVKMPDGRIANGEFATDPGTDFTKVAMPPDRLSPSFITTEYEILKPLPPEVLEGKIAPWFEQPGLGTQYYFEGGISAYVKSGYLKVVP